MSAIKSADIVLNQVNSSFESYMVEKAVSVSKVLEKAIAVEEPVKQLHESMRYSLLASDKRVWAAVSIAACELVGGQDSAAMPVACAIEMFYTGSCVLADLPCLYNNGMRWGKPANHVVFGEDVAILAGHALLALAMEHLASSCATRDVRPEKIVRAVCEIAKCMGSDGLAYDQFMNYGMSGRLKPLDEYDINFHKVEAFLEASLVLGAIVGGAEDQEIGELRGFARCVGPYFHMEDHLYGMERAKNMQTDENLCVVAKNHLIAASSDPYKDTPLSALVDFIDSYVCFRD